MCRWPPFWKISRIFRRGSVAFRPVFLSSSMLPMVVSAPAVRAGSAGGQPLQWFDHIATLFLPCLPFPNAASGRSPAAVAACLSLGACSSVTDSTRGALTPITPYKVEVVQGNFVSKEQVEALKPGMSRQQVREILGTSLLTDVFHANRWDYVFTIRRQGVEPQQRRLTLFFNGELLERFEGDPMPSEEEFVAKLDTRSASGKVPELRGDRRPAQEVRRRTKPRTASPTPRRRRRPLPAARAAASPPARSRPAEPPG